MTRTAQPWGMVYRRTSRGKLTRFWWLKYQFPGEPRRRHPTNPRTDDKAEAERQLHEILGERGHERRKRLAIEDVTVDDLLDRFLLDLATVGRASRSAAWRPGAPRSARRWPSRSRATSSTRFAGPG
jgi:hypothetical protein